MASFPDGMPHTKYLIFGPSVPIQPRLSRSELQAAFVGESADAFPPVLTTTLLAKLLGVPEKTVSHWVACGRLDGTFEPRGKRNFFLRDRVLDRIFNGPKWH